jgi:hypothetical protein
MADAPKTPSPWETAGVLALIIGGLLALWFYNGGPERYGSLRGIFISPLPPVGSGDVYGPTLGEPKAPNTNQ